MEARENLRETDKKETRLFVQTHPDVLVIPPDPPQMMIKVDQVRRVIETIYYRPAEGRERVYIFTDSAFMKEAANSLLKVLEEPPEFATIFLLTENPGELLPTIRSRSMVFQLGALSAEEIEAYLAKHRPEWKAAERALVARLCEGAVGRARSFDLAAYVAARGHALAILKSALAGGEHTELFKVTESYRPGAEGREKTEQLIRTLYSLLRDLASIEAGAPELVRNTDIASELKRLAESADFEWITCGVGPVGGGGTRDAAEFVAVAFAGCVCGGAGESVRRLGERVRRPSGTRLFVPRQAYPALKRRAIFRHLPGWFRPGLPTASSAATLQRNFGDLIPLI